MTMLLPSCTLTLESALTDWRDWIRKLNDRQLLDTGAAISRFDLRCSSAYRDKLEHITAFITAERAERFERLVMVLETMNKYLADAITIARQLQ